MIRHAAFYAVESGFFLRLGTAMSVVLVVVLVNMVAPAAWGKEVFLRSPEGCGGNNQDCTAYLQ